MVTDPDLKLERLKDEIKARAIADAVEYTNRFNQIHEELIQKYKLQDGDANHFVEDDVMQRKMEYEQ